MKVIFVAAMSENRVIGQKSRLPWHLPNDLKRFKQLTLGKPILMGRKTFFSIKRALPNRQNLVLTRDFGFHADDVLVMHSKDEVMNLEFAELFVIGGEEIFRLFLPECQTIHLTVVHAVLPGDTYFPVFEGFRLKHTETHPKDAHHAFSYSFCDYERVSAEP